MAVTRKDKGLGALIRRLRSLDGLTLDIGILGSDGVAMYNGTINMATVAQYNEFGTDGSDDPKNKNKGIPARSFMRGTLLAHQNEIVAFVSKRLEMVIQDLDTSKGAATAIGVFISDLISKRIANAKSWAAPNSATTIEKKGFDNPLHDSLRLSKAISWRMKKNGTQVATGKAVV
jgi:hypothetical protein